MTAEKWLPVPGYEGRYEVSDLGRVRSIARTDLYGRPVPEKILAQTKRGKHGQYRGVQLSSGTSTKALGIQLAREGKTDAEIGAAVANFRRKNARIVNRYTHRLVLEAFVGQCPDGMECAHENGDSTDNRLSNLSWKTPSANNLDKQRHGTDPQRNKTHCPNGHAYTEDNVYDPTMKHRRCITCAREKARNQGAPKTPRTHCMQGHALTPDNVTSNGSGGARKCRTCHNARARARARARRQGTRA